MLPPIERQIRPGLPLVGVPPYGQIHPHSTGNKKSSAKNEADYMGHKNINDGFYTHVVGDGRIIQVAEVGRGAYDVAGDWNMWTYAAVELIESHKTKEEFMRDYKIYVNLIRKLADEADIPKKLDSEEVGINTHDYCRKKQPNNYTDHVDPYPYLAEWGISKAQFKKDIEKGFEEVEVNPIVKEPHKPRHKVRSYWYSKGHPKLRNLMIFCDRNNIFFELRNKGKYTLIEMRFFAQKSPSKEKLIKYLEDNKLNYDIKLEFYENV